MKKLCTENCNECEVIQNRQLALMLNYLIEKYGEQMIQEVNKFCPNLTCCPGCRIDDFCHINGCEIYQEAKELAE